VGRVRTDLLKKLGDLRPLDQIYHLYENKDHFNQDLLNYLQHGYIYSSDDMFIMAKHIDYEKDPMDQWHSPGANCWFVRWAVGVGGLKKMMDSVKPMEWVMFKRVREDGQESPYRKYRWDRLYKIIERKNHGQ